MTERDLNIKNPDLYASPLHYTFNFATHKRAAVKCHFNVHKTQFERTELIWKGDILKNATLCTAHIFKVFQNAQEICNQRPYLQVDIESKYAALCTLYVYL